MVKKRYRIWYTLIGILLGMGAPAGWLVFKLLPDGQFNEASWRQDILNQPGLYWYMLGSTCLVFALFGFVLGWREEQLAERNHQLEVMAIHDPLTKLYNRQYLTEVLQKQIAQSFRYGQPVAVIMADLDFFKKVNDNYGHLAGDQVLVAFSEVLKATIRGSDLAFRYGGEEFVMVLPETSQEDGMGLAERIRAAVEAMAVPWKNGTLKITVSLGLTGGAVDAPTTGQNLIAQADEALYQAKQAGRNQVVAFNRG